MEQLVEGVIMSDDARRQAIGGQVREIGVTVPSLQTWRLKRLKTQKELAETSGVSRATVANAERGSRIAYATAEKLAVALDTTVAALEAAPPPEGTGGE